jgi:hypothetical protein
MLSMMLQIETLIEGLAWRESLAAPNYTFGEGLAAGQVTVVER